MVVKTDGARVHQVRKVAVELLLADHPMECLTCPASGNCGLLRVASYLGIDHIRSKKSQRTIPIDASNPFFYRDLAKCVLCGCCVRACQEIEGVGAIDLAFRGYQRKVVTFGYRPLGIVKVIVDEGLQDHAFIEARTQGFGTFKESLEAVDLGWVEQVTGVPRAQIAEAARLYAQSKPAAILYGMGITQHTHGTDNVLAVSNLALLTGNVGKPGSGINPLRGQNNVQGSCDMGALPNVYPGYQAVANPAMQERKALLSVRLSHKLIL